MGKIPTYSPYLILTHFPKEHKIYLLHKCTSMQLVLSRINIQIKSNVNRMNVLVNNRQ